MALDEKSFDQTMNGGWRAVARQNGCELTAAELIKEYRAENNNESSTLLWHEAQLRAGANQVEQAVELFEQTRKPSDSEGFGW